MERSESDRELAELRRQLAEARLRIAELEALAAHHTEAEQALRQSQQQLEEILTERRHTEARLQEHAHELGERVKELNCFFGISELVERPGISLPDIIQGIVRLLPPAWQYPQITCARAMLDGDEYRTENWAPSPWQQSAEIVVHDQQAGRLEVGYLEERPELDEGPFFKEERSLIDAVAERLGRIVERKRMEQALLASEERFRRVYFDAPFPIMIHAEDGEVIAINRVWTELTGYAHGEIPTIADWTERAYGERREWVRADIDRLYSLDARAQDGEYVIATRSGAQRTWEFSSAPLGQLPDGRRLVMSMAMDVTERKEAEEALRHYATELQARNEELDAFAHTVAHDLKNPLTRIIGFAELLTDEYETFTSEEVQRWLGTVHRNGRRMRGIVDELLLLSSVRKAEEVAVGPLDMGAIVAEVLDRLAPLIEERQGEVVVPESWPQARSYAPWIEEVWTNYLSNALKYGGQPPCVELGADERAGTVRFWVRDNGPGLSQEQQGRLFTPFTRLNATRAEGYGLGLSIVHRIAEKLGGQVGVESEPGQGSLFYFLLPQEGIP